MEDLSSKEKEQLMLIAQALKNNESYAPDSTLLGSLVKKCMVRTIGNTIRLTDAGKKALAE